MTLTKEWRLDRFTEQEGEDKIAQAEREIAEYDASHRNHEGRDDRTDADVNCDRRDEEGAILSPSFTFEDDAMLPMSPKATYPTSVCQEDEVEEISSVMDHVYWPSSSTLFDGPGDCGGGGGGGGRGDDQSSKTPSDTAQLPIPSV
ncbi:hypothetical protein CBS101457_000955 [Exobasidium rhododendri]|nr:hypothetical protein CBS101457_000955 [Exobasidium rhododendri]